MGSIFFSVFLLAAILIAVFIAVHQAEKIAERIGEPFGTLLLTVAVTVIEVVLIISIMMKNDSDPALVRDTVFSVIMIVCNGLVGLCILLGALRFKELEFKISGANAYIIVLFVLATLSLILPNHTVANPGPIYSGAQLAFVSAATLMLYGVFLFIQTVRHKDYFMPVATQTQNPTISETVGTNKLPHGKLYFSIGLLLISLLTVILLSKFFASMIQKGIADAGAPPELAGVLVAFFVLLPECVSAVKAARKNEIQKSFNLALGSSVATIGLTIPAVILVSHLMHKTLILGLNAEHSVLLFLTMIVSLVTFGSGRVNLLYGLVHLVIFITYIFLLFVP